MKNSKPTQELVLQAQADAAQMDRTIPYFLRNSIATKRLNQVTDAEMLTEFFGRVKGNDSVMDCPALFEELGYKIPVFPYTDNVALLHNQTAELIAEGKPYYLTNASGVPVFSLTPPTDEEAATFTESLTENEEQEYWANNPNRLKSVSDMLIAPEIDWIVPERLHRAGLFQLYGPSYAGKTLIVLDLVMSWCAGLETWQGYPLNTGGKPQQAVYVAAEGGKALSVHIDAWLKYHDLPAERLSGLLFLDGGEGDHMFLDLHKGKRDEPGVDRKDSWGRLVKEIVDADITPSMIIFDTQIDLAPGVEENSNTDMVNILRMVKRYADEMKFLAIVVHHTGHDTSKARGASGMKGKVDVQAKLSPIGEVGSGKARLEWEKVKGEAKPQEGASYEIKGRKLMQGFDSKGAICEPITPIDAAVAEQQGKEPDQELRNKILYLAGEHGASASAIAKECGLGRDSKPFKDAIEWMLWTRLLNKTGEFKSTKYYDAAFSRAAGDPEDY